LIHPFAAGVVTTTRSVNYETNTACTLEIRVYEGPYESYPAELIVQITDVNEPHTMDGLPASIGPLDVITIPPWTVVGLS
jgi:hypothetical protein